MERRREVSIIMSHRPVTSSDWRRKGSFSSEFFNSFASGCSVEQIPCGFFNLCVHDRGSSCEQALLLYIVYLQYHRIYVYSECLDNFNWQLFSY